jgi:hypothetical protein
MSEEVELDTNELRDTLHELQEERQEREETERKSAWTRYIALTTAVLAVFAAIGSLESGGLANEAMLLQIKAADKWNEYQAARQKDHLYTISAFTLLDHGAKPATGGRGGEKAESAGAPAHPAAHPGTSAGGAAAGGEAAAGAEHGKKAPEWRALSPDERLREYVQQAQKESGKEKKLQEEAVKKEEEAEHAMHRHHQFAQSVAFIQVAIALAAVAALARMKIVWLFSLLVGAAGLLLFLAGVVGR